MNADPYILALSELLVRGGVPQTIGKSLSSECLSFLAGRSRQSLSAPFAVMFSSISIHPKCLLLTCNGSEPCELQIYLPHNKFKTLLTITI